MTAGSPGRFSRASIPESEIERCLALVLAHPEYFDTGYVAEAYRSAGLTVLPDPFSDAVLAPIEQALRDRAPLSVLRFGDSEMNLLAFGEYAGIPNLDRHTFSKTVHRKLDSFEVTERWMTTLANWTRDSLRHADIVGVLGLWRPRVADHQEIMQGIRQSPDRPIGLWRGMDFMLRLAREGALAGKVIASAHLYLAVAKHLSRLVDRTDRLLCITNRAGAVEDLRRRYPSHELLHVPVGKGHRPVEEPVFLDEVEAALPADLQGWLCLVGAGPWAEIYCNRIRQRGGVAVDIGTGFDLMEGQLTRPVHRTLGEELLRSNNIIPT